MPTYVIAEAGTSHGGDLQRASELIRAAKESGADCVKFQCVIANEIVHPMTGAIELPGGAVDIHSRFRNLERPVTFYRRLKEYCDAAEIDFLCTAFGCESARIVEALDPVAHKIASPETNHLELLSRISSFGRPVFLSTGVTRVGDIERAVDSLAGCAITLLHCVTAYPAPESDYNIRLLPALRTLLGLDVGVSDHTLEPALIPTLAVAHGATVIEKHFTLSRSGSGLDDPIALDPHMFTELMSRVRRAEQVLRDSPEEGLRIVVDELCATYGRKRVNDVIGTGTKRLAAAELENYRTTRRSLLATGDFPPGHTLAQSDLAALRSERLAPGLDPSLKPVVIGAKLKKALANGEGLRWDHLL